VTSVQPSRWAVAVRERDGVYEWARIDTASVDPGSEKVLIFHVKEGWHDG
jgi:hypothetical protein